MTFANVAMTLALVFAMTGGAYAAKKYLITSTKQISPKVLKQLKGDRGPAGPAGEKGSAGANGVNGKDGANGINGKDGLPGKDGASVTSAAFPGSEEPAGEPCAAQGGSSFASASGMTYACNGKEGPPGPITGKLPGGVTLTGVWTVQVMESFHVELKEISYGLSLPSAPTVNYLDEAGTAQIGSAANCPGTAAEPKAKPGNLCIYVSEEAAGPHVAAAISPAPKSGEVLELVIPAETFVRGSWAVTA